MNVKTIKFIDKYIGKPLCWLIGLFVRKDTNKVAFIQLFGIGETILTLPAIKGYKEKNPNKKIVIICTKRNHEVYQDLDFIDEIKLISFNAVKIMWFMLRYAEYFDEVYDFEEYLNISALMASFIGRRTIGFDHGERAALFSKTVYLDDEKHFILNFCDITGTEYPDELVSLPFSKEHSSYVDKIIEGHNKIIGLFPGTAESAKWRMWPTENFIELGNKLKKKGFNPVLILGPHEKNDSLFKDFKIFRGTLHQLAALCNRCDYLVSTDTGPMHVAACIGTKTISLFGPNTPLRWGDGNGWFRNYICIYHKQSCSPCINNKKGYMGDCKDNKCMKSITVDEVLEKIK